MVSPRGGQRRAIAEARTNQLEFFPTDQGGAQCEVYRYDHVHLRSSDPDGTARFFEDMFGAEVHRSTYPPGTLYPGQLRVTMRLGGQTVLIAPPHPTEATGSARRFRLAQP
jgi:hypothetical protein